MEQKNYTLVTHPGKFHADDIFACATIELMLEKEGATYTVTRSRDQAIVSFGDFVFDIGGIDNTETKRFDHHQHGGAGTHIDGIPYASFGLVWRAYGEALCGDKEVAYRIEKQLVEPIDAEDNGVSLVEAKFDVVPFKLQDVMYVFRATWKEDESTFDTAFFDNVLLAKKIITRLISVTKHVYEAEVFVEKAYAEASDKRLIVLDTNYPYEHTLSAHSEPLFVIKPRPGGLWGLNTVPSAPFTFTVRKQLPEAWAGLRDEDMAKVSGVSDAIFCHNGRFLAVAKTKEGARYLAKIALSM